MTPTNPLILRCLALTGSFETSKLPPSCFSSVVGDFDGQGLSFSALQWNIGQGTLQPLLREMMVNHMDVMTRCFGERLTALQAILPAPISTQLSWARSIQYNHTIDSLWAASFGLLGATEEWQITAQKSAESYFELASKQKNLFQLTSDRATALMFDCAVQNGGIPPLAIRHVLAESVLGEIQIMIAIAEAVADCVNLKYHQDVLDRKLTIAQGVGVVHGLQYDLGTQFGL